MRSFILSSLALLALSHVGGAQFVQGVVVAEGDGRPLAGVRVELLDDSTVLAKTTTDSGTGAFYFDSPRPGKLQIVIYDRIDHLYASPAFDAGAASVIERKLVLPDLPASYTELPLFALTPVPPTGGRQPVPRYPDTQRRLQQTGAVHVSVIVDDSGHVERNSAFFAASTHADFTRAVRDVIGALQFSPAAQGERPSRVIVNTSFTFNIEGQPRRPCMDMCIVAWQEVRRRAGAN